MKRLGPCTVQVSGRCRTKTNEVIVMSERSPDKLVVAAGWLTKEELTKARPLTEEELQPFSDDEFARATAAAKARLAEDPELVLLDAGLVRAIVDETGGNLQSVEAALFQLHDERSAAS